MKAKGILSKMWKSQGWLRKKEKYGLTAWRLASRWIPILVVESQEWWYRSLRPMRSRRGYSGDWKRQTQIVNIQAAWRIVTQSLCGLLVSLIYSTAPQSTKAAAFPSPLFHPRPTVFLVRTRGDRKMRADRQGTKQNEEIGKRRRAEERETHLSNSNGRLNIWATSFSGMTEGRRSLLLL